MCGYLLPLGTPRRLRLLHLPPPPPPPPPPKSAEIQAAGRGPSSDCALAHRQISCPVFTGSLAEAREHRHSFSIFPPPPFFPSFSTCSLPAVPGVHALVYPQGVAFPEMKALDKSVANGSERGLAEANRRGWSISRISGKCCTKIWINSLQTLVELNLILYLVTFFSSVITCH